MGAYILGFISGVLCCSILALIALILGIWLVNAEEEEMKSRINKN